MSTMLTRAIARQEERLREWRAKSSPTAGVVADLIEELLTDLREMQAEVAALAAVADDEVPPIE